MAEVDLRNLLTNFQPLGIWKVVGVADGEAASKRPNGVGGRRGGKELSR